MFVSLFSEMELKNNLTDFWLIAASTWDQDGYFPTSLGLQMEPRWIWPLQRRPRWLRCWILIKYWCGHWSQLWWWCWVFVPSDTEMVSEFCLGSPGHNSEVIESVFYYMTFVCKVLQLILGLGSFWGITFSPEKIFCS